jgi:hypothetical protein
MLVGAAHSDVAQATEMAQRHRALALQAATATELDSDIVLVVGPGDYALGHVVLNRVTHLGVITFSGGTGKFTWFHARAVVNTSIQPVSEDGDYRFSPSGPTKESSPVSGSARRGELQLTKECSQYTGLADSFCTITSSNLTAIPVGSREVALQAATATELNSDIVLVVGPGDYALAHVVLNRVTHLGVITYSGGRGTFRWFHAHAIVNTSIQPVSENGDYRFRPGVETKES